MQWGLPDLCRVLLTKKKFFTELTIDRSIFSQTKPKFYNTLEAAQSKTGEALRRHYLRYALLCAS